MPISLPASLSPQSVSWTRNRPRNVTQSTFTGYTQQVLSGTTFLSGEVTFPSLITASQTRDWQRFFAYLEVGNNDGTFWVPIWTEDYDDEDSTGIDWNAGVASSTSFRVTAPDSNYRAMMANNIGRNIQVRSTAAPDASLVFTQTLWRPVRNSPDYDVFVSETIPFADQSAVQVNGGKKVMARALLPNPVTQTIVTDAVTGSAATTMAWTEAIGHILQDIQSP